MYAVVRELRFDLTRLASAGRQLEEFRQLHASQPGFLGSLSVDIGDGRRVVINLWQSEAQAMAGREAVGQGVRRLLEPLMAAPAELIGVGEVVENDLIKS
jgi:hypothetical protein